MNLASTLSLLGIKFTALAFLSEHCFPPYHHVASTRQRTRILPFIRRLLRVAGR